MDRTPPAPNYSIDSCVGARPLSQDQKALLHFKHPPAAQHEAVSTGSEYDEACEVKYFAS